MMHITSSVTIGALLAAPYILVELFYFILPALYDNERHYAVWLTLCIYLLFALGVLMSYFILFPISFRFLGTYQVDPSVTSTITLSSYISTFATLTFIMGIVFQLPILAFILAKMQLVTSDFLKQYRRHAFILIMLVAAIITPPDIFTLVLVTIPLYLLFELCIVVIRHVEVSITKHFT